MPSWLPLLLVLVAGPALGLSVEFPSATSQLFNDGTISTTCGGPLGSGGTTHSGVCHRNGDGIEQSYAGTGLTSVTGLHLVFEMSDATSLGFDPQFDVLLNDVVVGSYTLADPNKSFDLQFVHAPISGPVFTIKIVQTGGFGTGSYNWIPGGTVDIVPEPAPALLLACSFFALALLRRRACPSS